VAWALLRPPACTFYRLFLVCLLTFNANVTPYSASSPPSAWKPLQPCQADTEAHHSLVKQVEAATAKNLENLPREGIVTLSCTRWLHPC
jgi:hypothetical protein